VSKHQRDAILTAQEVAALSEEARDILELIALNTDQAHDHAWDHVAHLERLKNAIVAQLQQEEKR